MNTTVSRPSRSWELQTLALLALGAVAEVGGLILLIGLISVRHMIVAQDPDTSALTDYTFRHSLDLDVSYFLLALAYLGAFAWWRNEARKLVARFGDKSGTALVHWTVYACSGLLVLSFILSLDNGTYGQDGVSGLNTDIVRLAVRVVALGLLLVGVVLTRGQIRRTIADSEIYSPVPVRRREPGPILAPAVVFDKSSLPPADDAFWARVREMSIAAGDELPLLESTSNLIRRWSLIPSASAVDGIRASLPPGTAITVFPVPPRPGVEAPDEPPAAEAGQWFGLTEDAATGMLWFRLLQPSRVPEWLAKAKSAQRFGLYQADDPAALTAVIPGR